MRWQAKAERRWVADLLANEAEVAPLQRLLKATQVRKKRRGKGKRVGMRAEKWPSR